MKTKMKTKLFTTVAALVFGVWCLVFVPGCAGPQKLEPGGVYAPTNAAGEVVTNERALALADASYKFAYETALAAYRFERDNRELIWRLSPTIGARVKAALDDARATTWDIDQRWARARQAYRANPTPAGLSAVQTALAELERIIPVIQSQLAPVYQLVTQPNP